MTKLLAIAFDKCSNFFVRPFDRLLLQGIGAEIGVFKGEHAAAMLRLNSAIETLYLVDPYQEYDGGTQCIKLGAAERKAHWRLRHYNFHGTCQWIKGGSRDASKSLPDLDFAYIDGNHSAPFPAQDISNIWPLIKSGGVLGGHDFFHKYPAVIEAVTQFTVREKLQLHVNYMDWWVFKP